jgi:hypothetical protein
VIKLFGFVSVFAAFGSIAFASNYPIYSETKQSCQTQAAGAQGQVQVCRGMKMHDGSASLTVTYDGMLFKEPGLKVYVQINYMGHSRSELFPMTYMDYQHNSDRAIAQITGGCIYGQNQTCKVWGTPEMKNLLFWAQQPYVFKLNQLNLEVAFVSDNQELGWDNNGEPNKNYHFSFPEN